MNFGRNQPKKGGFDLSKFYQDLGRVQSSLNKPAPRKTANSLSKNIQNNKAEQERAQHLQSFKSDIKNKNLAKAKIHIQQSYEKAKVSKTQNQDKNNESRIYRLSEIEKEQREDPWQDVRGKLQRWNAYEEESKNKKNEYQSSFSKTTNNSHLYFDKKDANIQENMENSTEMPPPVYQQTQDSATSAISKSLFCQLEKRNKIYGIVEKGIKVERSYYKKQATDLSIKLKQNLREAELMKDIIEQFKQICGLKITDYAKLYDVLKSNSSQSKERSYVYVRDSSGVSEK